MLKLIYYAPEAHVNAINQALFEAGAGRIGTYDRCCWMTAGIGQFRALEGSDPFIGQQGVVEQEAEMKVEMVLENQLQDAVRDALHAAHPYETPAYQFIEVST